MYFSEKFNISKEDLLEYGAVDISLDIDLPFFIDPMLLYYSENEEYHKQHESIIAFFAFLAQLTSEENGLSRFDELFQCREIPNNWFGFCYSGNRGKGSSRNFADSVFLNLTKLYNSTIEPISHFEHIFLFGDYVGKDRISDLCVNLLLGFLANYTQQFVQKYEVNPELCDSFPITVNQFNNDTGDYEKVIQQYYLPYKEFELTKKREYILLTPFDIVSPTDSTLNPKDFGNSYDRMYRYLSLSNPELKAKLELHFQTFIKLYLEK